MARIKKKKKSNIRGRGGGICAPRAKQEIVPFMILDLLTGCNDIPNTNYRVTSPLVTIYC